MSTEVGIINYRTGNSRSFSYALDHCAIPNRLVDSPADCASVTHLVLPGVGAADVTMTSLTESGWVSYLNDRVRGEGLPFLGVCVGLQVLFDYSEEGDVECLGWLPGYVRRFTAPGLRIPHMGWNAVEAAGVTTLNNTADATHPLRAQFIDPQYFYFVNSFHAVPPDPRHVLATTDYGGPFASVVGSGPLVATQFHVEKSGHMGLNILRTFAALTKEDFADAV